MKSVLTKKKYDMINFVQIDPKQRILMSPDGVVFEELADGTWIGVNSAYYEGVRYYGTVSHNGGISFNPLYELIGGEWFFIATGEPAPSAVKKKSQNQ